MEKISETEYIISYEELMNIIVQGYYLASHMKIAIEEKLITENENRIHVYINHKSKVIDIFGELRYDEYFRRHRFTNIEEVLPDKKVLVLPDCFGNIINEDGQLLHELDFCMNCKYHVDCYNRYEYMKVKLEWNEQNDKIREILISSLSSKRNKKSSKRN